jgi:catechol 2,3-dioxygenase-like lactoylglutathione lyase family enzyme
MSTTRDVIIQSERFDQAAAFYRDVLGFQPTVENDRLVGFETGSFQLFVEPGSRPGAVFDIEFDDLAAAKRLLLAHGCTIVDEDPSYPRCHVRDPHGLLFNIAER